VQTNRTAAVARIHASEHGLNIRASEPGHVSVNGVSLRAYNTYIVAKDFPSYPEPAKDAPENDPTVTAAADWLSSAIGYSPDISASRPRNWRSSIGICSRPFVSMSCRLDRTIWSRTVHGIVASLVT
jgi:hypothetical protein